MGHPSPIQSSGREESQRTWQTLAEFAFPSRPGAERQAMEQVALVFEGLGLSQDRLERLKTAVAESILNAMEHGNGFRPELMALVKVLLSEDALAVHITDFGGQKDIPVSQTPDLEAKLAGLQSPRGWGLFIIKNMVDEMRLVSDATHHTIQLIMVRKGVDDGKAAV
jgi:anti-sigma regulatory factor (Ser/Thr protein kinase)